MTEKAIKEKLCQYSERFYAKPLKEAGFTSYRNDMLNWYKVYNGIICHFHIVSLLSQIPSLMLVWRFHPTYVPATLNIPAVWTNFRESGGWSFYTTEVHFQPATIVVGGQGCLPDFSTAGIEKLNKELFVQMENLQTREELYIFRRKEIISRCNDRKIPLSSITTPDFADEALIMKDKEMFAPCIKYIETIIPRAHHKSMQQSAFGRSPDLLKAQLGALRGEAVAQYFELLKERKAQFLKRYKLQDTEFEL